MVARLRTMTTVPTALLPAVVALVLAAVCATAGCDAVKYVSYVVAGSEKRVTVTAAYRGLANRSFAVLVAADEYALSQHPRVVADVSRSVTAAVVASVDAARPMDPDQIVTFQRDNPFWTTSPPADLIERLKVDRLLMVWLVDYALREPGNAHVWRGVMVANVDVIEAEAPDPNNAVYRATVKAVFPPNSSVGLLNANDRTIEFGLLQLFSRQVGNLFVDHKAAR